MAITKYQFLTEQGVQKFAEQLLGKVNVRIGERIVTSVDETVTDKQVASAKAVYDLIKGLQTNGSDLATRVDEHDEQLTAHGESISAINEAQGVQDGKIADLESGLSDLTTTVNNLTHLTIETVVGSIETVTDPKTDVIYLQKDDESDPSWMMYIKTADGWINVGDTEVDLSNYWTKDDTEEMREALGIHDAEAIPEENIVNAVETAFTATAVDLTT